MKSVISSVNLQSRVIVIIINSSSGIKVRFVLRHTARTQTHNQLNLHWHETMRQASAVDYVI